MFVEVMFVSQRFSNDQKVIKTLISNRNNGNNGNNGNNDNNTNTNNDKNNNNNNNNNDNNNNNNSSSSSSNNNKNNINININWSVVCGTCARRDIQGELQLLRGLQQIHVFTRSDGDGSVQGRQPFQKLEAERQLVGPEIFFRYLVQILLSGWEKKTENLNLIFPPHTQGHGFPVHEQRTRQRLLVAPV